MIHYYFGSKEVLLRTVLERAVEPLAEAIETLKATSKASPDFIVRTLMSTIARHPGLPYLVLREVMLPGGTMQAHFAGHLAPRLGGALPDILDTLQRREEIRDDPPPATAALILLSLVMFPFIVRPIAEQVLGVGLHGDALESFQDHVAAFVQRGFLP